MSRVDTLGSDAALSRPAIKEGARTVNWQQAMERAQTQTWLLNRDIEMSLAASVDRSNGKSPETSASLASMVRVAQWCGEAIPHVARLDSPLTRKTLPLAATLPTSQVAQFSLVADVLPGEPEGGRVLQSPSATARANESALYANEFPDTASTSQSALDVQRIVAAREPHASQSVRKRSVHVERAFDGVTVWVRDASISGNDAAALAYALLGEMTGGDAILSRIYVNGEAVDISSARPGVMLSKE